MKFLRSLGIRTVLFGGFAGVVVLFIATALVGIATSASLENKLEYMGGNLFRVAEQVNQAGGDLMDAGEDLSIAAAAPDQQQASEFLARAKQNLDSSQQQLNQYRQGAISADERKALDQFDAEYKSFLPLFTQVQTQLTQNTPDRKKTATDVISGPLHASLDRLKDDLEQLVKLQGDQTQASRIVAAANYGRSLKILIATMIIGLAGATAVGLFLSNSVTSAIGQVTAASKQIAREDLPSFVSAVRALAAGDLTQDLTVSTQRVTVLRRDELGALAQDFNHIVDGLRETGGAFLSMRDGLRSLVTRVKSWADALAAASVKLGQGTTHAGEAVRQVAQAIQEVADGTQSTSNSAAMTSDGVQQLGMAIDSVARGATEQAAQVGAVSKITKDMVAHIDQVTGKTVRVAAASEQAREAAVTGAKAVQETITGMEEIRDVVAQASAKVQELGALGQRIGAVVETIDDIAEQTNLLALNAAIEAARAGQNGAGFAVVADAVGKLADRSHDETKAIAGLIEQVQQGTQQAVQAMESGSQAVAQGAARADQAGKALAKILDVVEATAAQIADIASAAQVMADSSKTVMSAMQSISGVIEQNTAATEEMAAQAAEVSEAFQSIASASVEQSAAAEEVNASADGLRAQVEEMSAQAEELAEMAEALTEVVAQFKLDLPATETLPPNVTRLSLAG